MSFSQSLPHCRLQTFFYSCNFCSFETRRQILFERHVKRCSGASSSSPSSSAASNALSPSTLPAPSVCRNYKCSKCNFVSNKAKLFLYHQRQVHGENIAVYGCNECEYASRHKNKVLRHKRLVHKVISSAEDIVALEDQCLVNSPVQQNDSAVQGPTDNADGLDGIGIADNDESLKQFLVPNQNTEIQIPGSGGRNEGQGGERLEGNLLSDRRDKWILHRVNAVDGLYRCKFCRYSNPHKWKIASHMRTSHSRKTLYKCSQCSFVTERKIEWCAHKTLHSGKAIYSCGECAYQTTMKRNFERHQERHLANEPRRCSLCSYSSTGEGAIQRHMAEYHPPSPGKIDVNMSEETQPDEEANVPKGCFVQCASPNDQHSAMQSSSAVTHPSYSSVVVSSSESNSSTVPSVSTSVASIFVPSLGFHDPGVTKSLSYRNRFDVSKSAQPRVTESRWTCSLCPLGYKRAADLNRHMKRKHGTSLKDIKSVGSKSTLVAQSSKMNTSMLSSPSSVANISSNTDQHTLPKSQSVLNRRSAFNFAKCSSENNNSAMMASIDEPLNLSLKKNDSSANTDWEQLEVLDLSTKTQSNRVRNAEVSKNHRYSHANETLSESKGHAVQHACGEGFHCSVCTKNLNRQLDMPKHKKSEHRSTSIIPDEPIRDSLTIEGSVAETGRQHEESSSTGKNAANIDQNTEKQLQCHLCDYKAIWKADIKNHLLKRHRAKIKQQDGIRELLDLTYQLCASENDDNCNSRKPCEQHCFRGGNDDDFVDYNMNVEVNDNDFLSRTDGSNVSLMFKDRRLIMCPFPDCKFVSEIPAKLKIHLESHDTLKRFMCMHCGQRYSWLWDIRKHIRRSHPGVDMTIRELSDEDIYSESFAEFISTDEHAENKQEITILKEGLKCGNSQESSTLSSKELLTKSPSNTDSMDVERLAEQYANEVAAMFYGGNNQSSPESSSTNLIQSWDQGMIAIPAQTLVKKKFGRPSKSLLLNRFRPFKCSECGRRSNWRWDLNKHIRTSHPGAHLIELTETEAKSTFHEVLRRDFRERQQLTPMEECVDTKLKPYMCDTCGYRSNWKCDVSKHIRSHHPFAHMITLAEGQARATIAEYDAKQDALHETVDTGTTSDNGPIPLTSLCVTVDNHKLKRFKCSVCPYRSNFRSDVGRHIRHKHDKGSSRIIVMNENEAAETLKEYMETWARKKFVSSPSKKCSSFNRRHHGQSSLSSITRKEFSYQQQQSADREERICCTIGGFRSKSRNAINEHWQQGQCKNTTTSFPNCKFHSGSEMKHTREASEFMAVENTTENALESLDVEQSKKDLNVKTGILVKSLLCNICPYETNKTWLLKIHKSYHRPNGTNKYKCRYCPYFVSASHLLHQHMRLHFRVNNCNRGENTKRNSRTVKKAANSLQQDPTSLSKMTYFCLKCPHTSTNRNDYLYHRQFHRPRNTPSFKCDRCPYWVSQKHLLVQHIKVHRKEYQQICAISVHPRLNSESPVQSKTETYRLQEIDACSFGNSIVLNSGATVESNACEKDKETKSMKITSGAEILCLQVQNGNFERQSKSELSVVSISERLECSDCPYVTFQQSSFKKHLSRHGRGQKFECNMCNFSVSSLHQLRRHKKLHGCQKTTRREQTADETCESRYDEIKKTYCCDMCPYSNARRDHLMCHVKFHLNKSDLQCPHCSYSVSRVHLLNQHLKVHNSFLLSAQTCSLSNEENVYNVRQKKVKHRMNETNQLSTDSQTSFVVWMNKKLKSASNLLPWSNSCSDGNSNSDDEQQLKKMFMHKLRLRSSQSPIFSEKDRRPREAEDNVYAPGILTLEDQSILSLTQMQTLQWKCD